MVTYNFVKNFKHIHFVGIGGINMSALAKLCLSRGKTISGSDRVKSHITKELEHLGITIYYKHQKKNISGADLVVYTCAVGENNIEVITARSNGIKTVERAEFLGEIAKEYEEVIAVAGSHGKTTVCGMIDKIFEEFSQKPTLIVGGETSTGNLIIGKKKFLIVEACEYKEHFLKIPHTAGVILNIDFDHPDYFKTKKNYEKAFIKFAQQSKKNVFIDERHKIIFGDNNITFGTGGDFSAHHIIYKENFIIFDVYKNNTFYEKFKLNCIGTYNVKNALCSIAVADYYDIDKKCIKSGIEKFENLKRRYEYMGKVKNNIVITDYAHHPTQIINCINATREVYNKKITVVFEPHTYSRTKALHSEFVNSLSFADNIILLPTYSAREKPIKGGRSRDIYEMLSHIKSNVSFIKTYSNCLKELENLDNNIILILGAGSVIKLAETIKNKYLQAPNIV